MEKYETFHNKITSITDIGSIMDQYGSQEKQSLFKLYFEHNCLLILLNFLCLRSFNGMKVRDKLQTI